MNRDIIYAWQLKKYWVLETETHHDFKWVLKTIEENKAIYVRGNHDDFLDPNSFTPWQELPNPKRLQSGL